MTILRTLRWLIWLIAAFVGLGCSSAVQAPAPPPTSTSSNLQADDFGDDDDFDDDDEDDDDDDDEDDDDDDDSDYERGGADVGDDELQEQVMECLDSGRFYDRFAGDSGKCSRRKLANMDCTEDGIADQLSKKLRQQFEDALESSSYNDYVIDQCVDCPPGTSNSICEQSETGASQTGTKVFFVKEEDTELLGKAILLPIRPNQNQSDDDEDEDEDDEDDDDDDEDDDDE